MLMWNSMLASGSSQGVMARSYRLQPPRHVVRLGIAEVLLADRPVAVGRVTLTNEVAGTIDFAACASVQPQPGDYVIRLASGAEYAVSIGGLQPVARVAVRLTSG